MKNRLLKTAALTLTFALTAGMMTGCGSSKATSTKTEHGNDVLFSYDGEDVTLKEAWIYGKNSAMQYESYYASYFGENFWSMSMGTDEEGNLLTFEDYVKQQVVSQMKQIIVLDHKAADYDLSLTEEEIAQCEEYAETYVKDVTGKEIVEECGAKVEDVTEIYKDNALAAKVKDAIIAEVDKNVSDEEARSTKVYRVVFATSTTEDDGTTKDMTDDEKAAVKKNAEAALKDIKAGKKTIEDVAEELEYTNTDETFAAGEAEEGEEFEAALKEAKDGDVIDGVYETSNGYAIAKLVAYTDKDSTEANKESIIAEREQKLFADTYAEWTETLEADWDYHEAVNHEIWVDFKLAQEEATTEMMEETAPTAEASTEE